MHNGTKQNSIRTTNKLDIKLYYDEQNTTLNKTYPFKGFRCKQKLKINLAIIQYQKTPQNKANKAARANPAKVIKLEANLHFEASK